MILRYGGTKTATGIDPTTQTQLTVWAAPVRASTGHVVTYGSTSVEVAPSRSIYRTRSITGVGPQTLTSDGASATIGGQEWPIQAAYHDSQHRHLIIEL